MIVRGGEIAGQKVLRAGELHLQMVVQLGQVVLEDMIFVALPVQQEEKVQESNKRGVFFNIRFQLQQRIVHNSGPRYLKLPQAYL